MARRVPPGLRRIRLMAGVLVLAAFLLALVGREERLPPLRSAPPPATPPRPPFVAGSRPPESPLEGLVRRYADQDVILEVIYANPLLPADEAKNPIFRIIAVFRKGSSPPESFVTDLHRGAQLRSSDRRVLERPSWQEEVRRGNRILGYLCFSPVERHPWLTRRTRWIELDLRTVASSPLRFRWPVAQPSGE